MDLKNTVIIGLSNGSHIAKSVAKSLKLEYVDPEVTRFADGEILVKVKTTVRNRNVYLFQSTSNPVNDNLMELLIAIDMLKRASANKITVIIPYYGYARQDRKSSGREPITAKLVADLITKAGAHKVILLDIHSEQIQGFFDIPVDTLRSTYTLLSNVIKDINQKNWTIISPDYGAVKRARRIATALELPLAIVDKRRPKPNQVEVSNVLGEVNKRDCIIVDDMIDTGNTIIKASELLMQKGAKSVNIVVTHGVFSKNALENLKKSNEKGTIKKIYVTNSINWVGKIEDYNFIKIVDVSQFLADIIKAHENHTSVSEVYNKYANKLLF
jgi:ribose-phosphate pyrophosphokinase